MRSVVAGQSDARLKIWCYHAVPCNFQSKHSLPRSCAAFLFSGGKLVGPRRNGIPSFWKYLSPALPSHPLVPTGSLFKAFHAIHGMKIFIVIAEIGTSGWATTGWLCKALSRCFLGIGWGSGDEWHNYRARKDQASRFAVNILNRKQKTEEEIANHPAKLQYVVKEMTSATARKTVEGEKSQEAITGLVLKAILQWH